ncbi:radical SAM protein [Breoghania sp. L-A4]|uniref:radical SAM protein n=1 Tax=Breoghania sp. L-A4 TaxID=2304600 RepID=UPI000E358898|nr:radical SAM protein [Breoghania sp. L-A4]AXS39713.1 radical SAM protein [Breoghania sp. L-A4]
MKGSEKAMDVYLIAPMPTFGLDTLVSDKVVHLNERYALMAAAGIATVAAFFDSDFGLRLCDELIEDVDFEDPSEVICISMNVAQAARGIEIARRFRAMGRTVIMGGAHVSLAPEVFEGEAECLVIGEMEPVAEEFVRNLRDGQLKPRYHGSKADMAQSPPPRWDLYRNDRAVSGVVQTSRGCPFECNFCDVIQYLGRTQRHKPTEAVIAETQSLYDHGYRSIQLSDDNFTVYRQRTRTLLDALAAWNGRDGRDPVQFITQASIDLARDDDLLQRCNEAGVRDIFIGIETSNIEALKESKKRQNLRQDLVQQTGKIVEAGIAVTSGMMVGFDADDLSCFERQFAFGMALPIVTLRVTVLVAPIATPLYAQMKAEGRLFRNGEEDVFPGGDLWTNIEPLNMSREQLAEGAVWLVNALLEPDNVIRRFEHMTSLLGTPPEHLRRPLHQKMGGTGAAAMLKLMRVGAKDPGARRVIEAVNELSKARPEISWDLATALSSYLNSYLSVKQLQGHRTKSGRQIAAYADAS